MIDFNLSELRETYYSEINSLAEDYRKRIDEGEFGDRESFMDDVHETIDGHEFVIYTHKARCVCLASFNDGAIEDLGPDRPAIIVDGEIQWSAIAFYAMEADLYEALGALGVDVNEPVPDGWVAL